MAKHVRFVGWTDHIEARDTQSEQIGEHDILRMVILAEDDDKGRWVVFQCEDRMHAIKVASVVKKYDFAVEIASRRDRVYLRRKPIETPRF